MSENNSSQHKPVIFLPIPAEHEQLLKKKSCNFSLYSPRMVRWKIKGKEIEADTETLEELKEAFNSNSTKLRQDLMMKQNLQSSFIKAQQAAGLCTFEFYAKTVSPFISGLGAGHPTETGMILDRNLGVPYIPASSIKGVVRLAHAINIAQGRTEVPDSELEKYFGTADTKQEKQYRGQLVFLDAYPVNSVTLKLDIMNPHYGQYYRGEHSQPVETENPIPIKFLSVEQGTEFCFRVVYVPLNIGDVCDEVEIRAMFTTAFECVGFGGKTAIGYGRFKEREKNVQQSQNNSSPAQQEIVKLAPGEYDAVVELIDKRTQSIFFSLKKNKFTAVKQNCKSTIIAKYRKNTKVKIKLSGGMNKDGIYFAEIVTD